MTHTIHGTGIFTYIWLIFYGFHVGKYTSPMNGMCEDILGVFHQVVGSENARFGVPSNYESRYREI